MEEIITVKQEPTEEHFVPTTVVAGNATASVTSSQASTTPIITAVTNPETQPRQTCAILPQKTQAQTPLTPTKTVQIGVGHTSPQVVMLSGSPIKLTQVRGPFKTTAAGGQIPIGKGVQQISNVTFVQVPSNTFVQNAGVRQGSPLKQGVVPRVIPISLAVNKSQAVSSSHMTISMTTSGTVTVRAIAPKMNIAPTLSASQTIQLAPKPPLVQASGASQQGQQRFIIPAIAPNTNTTNLQFPHGVISGGVVYLPQQALQSSGSFPIAVPLQANAFTPNNQQGNLSSNGASPDPSPPSSRPRKPCNCTKSQCLKLYCDCFAQGEFCSNCNCVNCSNNIEHERERSKAIKACLERNPHAFHPKIGKGKVGESERRHNKGCHCKRSGCLKNYCECYEAKILCTSLCKCTGCKNFEESPERKTLMHLADAAEVRVKQQNAAKTKLESQIEDLPTRPPTMTSSGERLPFSFVTEDVAQATCQCVIAQAVEAEKMGLSPAMAEKMILEEFGRSLLQIIHTASKTKAEQ
ncbi:protein lin-54 homolog isoform X2 [Nematostella vectensis]|uniref:protein lin-54 homolog isoform X2 n=1 Tax=Nematostella vectensis TaxID=45351 RepID=UPI00138FFC42|nr:protein lin-54 homolog isoform X2 [Nematostella vectensis]